MSNSTAFMSPRVVAAVLVRPGLWFTALRQMGRLSPRGWWHTPPFLPIPPDRYMEFRLVTQYGGDHGSLQGNIRPKDVVDYLQWCKQWNQSR